MNRAHCNFGQGGAELVLQASCREGHAYLEAFVDSEASHSFGQSGLACAGATLKEESSLIIKLCALGDPKELLR